MTVTARTRAVQVKGQSEQSKSTHRSPRRCRRRWEFFSFFLIICITYIYNLYVIIPLNLNNTWKSRVLSKSHWGSAAECGLNPLLRGKPCSTVGLAVEWRWWWTYTYTMGVLKKKDETGCRWHENNTKIRWCLYPIWHCHCKALVLIIVLYITSFYDSGVRYTDQIYFCTNYVVF